MSRTRATTTSDYLTLSRLTRAERQAMARKQQRIARQQLRKEGALATRGEVLHLIATRSGETKYFDCAFQHAITMATTTWADTELPMDHYVDSSGASGAYTDSALLPTAIGSAYGQVNGNRYHLQKLRVRGYCAVGSLSDQADAATSVNCRALLIMDLQPNGAQAQGEDILQAMGTTPGDNLMTFKRVSNTSSRFRILKDEFFVLNATNSQTDGASTGSIAFETKNFSWQYKPRKPIEVNIKSGNATPTVAGLVNCNIFCLFAAVRGDTSVALTVRGNSRAYYKD